MVRSNFRRKWKYGRFAHAQCKICNITLIYGRIAEISASFRKSESRNTILSGVRDINLPEAIQFCSQDALRMHYRQITYEVTLISSDHYKNSSVIVDLAMGQIPGSTERISSNCNVLEFWTVYRCRFCSYFDIIELANRNLLTKCLSTIRSSRTSSADVRSHWPLQRGTYTYSKMNVLSYALTASHSAVRSE